MVENVPQEIRIFGREKKKSGLAWISVGCAADCHGLAKRILFLVFAGPDLGPEFDDFQKKNFDNLPKTRYRMRYRMAFSGRFCQLTNSVFPVKMALLPPVFVNGIVEVVGSIPIGSTS